MTTHDRDKIIAAAKDAGIKLIPFVVDDEEYDFCDVEMDDDENLERFYAIAFEAGRQAEREECAKACEEIRVIVDGNHAWTGLHVQEQCINTIRARGDTK